MARETLKPRIVAKRWSTTVEHELLKAWEIRRVYRFNRDSGKAVFSIDTPPPYASGKWHVGGAAHYAHIDMVARYFRMAGREVLFPFGVDRNGLPVEVQVERSKGVRAHELPREEFLKLCQGFLDSVESDILRIGLRMGMSCDFNKIYRTDSPSYRSVTQATFIQLWDKGLVYEDDRPTNWCPVCGTAVADAEIDYVEVETDLVYVKFKVKGIEEDLLIATTRPELLSACAIVLFNPTDERYQHLQGLTAIVPLYGQEVPIKAHQYAKPEFGTGLVMMCSFGDYSDVRIFRELGLKPVSAIDEAGMMTAATGVYVGLNVEEARTRIIQDLRNQDMLGDIQKTIHRTPVCWRSRNPVEFISVPEYYLKQLPFLEDLRKVVDTVQFHPPESRQILLNWVDSITTDWPISRRRFYGTEIPVWYCKRCRKAHLPQPGAYNRPWRDPPPSERCTCGSTEFIGEERTFDTWMDSSISQLYVIGFMQDDELFSRSFPCTLRPQGYEIVRTWLYYSILKTYELFGKPAFYHVRISGMGLDEKGEAMHKSRGNVVDPEPILEKYGADAFRFWAASEAKLGSDYRFSEKHVETAALFITKLWNISRFISSFPQPEGGYELTPLDRLILGELNQLIRSCSDHYDALDPYIPSNAVRAFAWNLFADHYVEAAKSRAYNKDGGFTESQQRGAWYTLHTCLQTTLKLLAPVCPFATDAVWLQLYGEESIHLTSFPKPSDEWISELIGQKDIFSTFNAAIWRLKKERGVALNQGLDVKVYAPASLMPFKEDLSAMHKVRSIEYEEPPKDDLRKIIQLGEGIYLEEELDD